MTLPAYVVRMSNIKYCGLVRFGMNLEKVGPFLALSHFFEGYCHRRLHPSVRQKVKNNIIFKNLDFVLFRKIFVRARSL